MIFNRVKYVKELIDSRCDGLVKIVTGIRRSGKSFLLFRLWHNWLLEHETDENHIIEIQLDNIYNSPLRKPLVLLDYISSRILDRDSTYYVILDEVQFVENFVEVMLSLTHMGNVDLYVTGSNSRFLSSDIVTEFRGRGEEIRIWPLTFSEYFDGVGGDIDDAWFDYYTYGGLPQVAFLKTEKKKKEYLRNIYEMTYLRDILERHSLRNPDGLKELVRVLASAIGALSNPNKIANTFRSTGKSEIGRDTIERYIQCLKESFLIEGAQRFDLKGRRYISAEEKYYFTDLGIRAAILDFRQQEESHIVENILYNELRARGYLVDVGAVDVKVKDATGKFSRRKLEVDFVLNRAPEKIYIQSALHIPDAEKEAQEKRSLLAIHDHFRKVIVVGDSIHRKEDENGITTIRLYDFLRDATFLEDGN